MYQLIATAAAGLNAGSGLHAALCGGSVGGADAGAGFHRRTRVMGLLLTAVSSGAAAAAYYDEGRGDLWLAAAAVSSLSLPYQLLLMSPPSGAAAGPSLSDFTPGEYSTSAKGGEDVLAAAGRRVGFAAEGVPGAEGALDSRAAVDYSGGGAGGERSAASSPPRRSRLMYAKSGVLLSPTAYAQSWVKRYWFGAALSGASFAVMMAILGSRRESSSLPTAL